MIDRIWSIIDSVRKSIESKITGENIDYRLSVKNWSSINQRKNRDYYINILTCVHCKNNFRIRGFGNFEEILTIFPKSFKIEVYYKTFLKYSSKINFLIMNWLKIKNQISKNQEKIDFLKANLIDHRLIRKKNTRKHTGCKGNLEQKLANRNYSFH